MVGFFFGIRFFNGHVSSALWNQKYWNEGCQDGIPTSRIRFDTRFVVFRPIRKIRFLSLQKFILNDLDESFMGTSTK
uniref:Uncharacterized protein n=1 Tax=Leptospira santarosai serovar Arenal str. MAVJ 401 TaxID=1049976 RepID=M6JH47_9LEPT|nr:hypothetical protein LEP1GSC063_4336 [Leptospira santarosai serovar Arenal str. MAVJ 401]